jgi:hypothetical protein
MVSMVTKQLHYFFEEQEWPHYDEDKGFWYEWVEHTRFIEVWPKGQFRHRPEPGSIDLQDACEVMGLDWPSDSRDLTVELVATVLTYHEQTLRSISGIDGSEAWHHDEETDEWYDAIQEVLDKYYSAPEV